MLVLVVMLAGVALPSNGWFWSCRAALAKPIIAPEVDVAPAIACRQFLGRLDRDGRRWVTRLRELRLGDAAHGLLKSMTMPTPMSH